MGTSSWVEVDGAALAAEFADSEGANGVPLVFLHAGVADRRMWQAQWQAFAPRHRLLRYDRRGFGESRTLKETPHSLVADLWAVMDSCGLERAVLVGCSQGGRVAIDAALARPHRVQGLVLVAPAVGGAPEAALAGDVQMLDEAIAAAEAADDLDTINELEAQLWLDGPGSPRGRVGGAERQLFLAMNGIALRAIDPGPEIEEDPAWARLKQLHMPTLVLWGDLDLPQLQARGEALVQRIPAAQRVVLSGTAHLPGFEAPQRFNAALASFLAGLEAAPG
jgi:pimeloyl-ACP methyl ester carboxylesterase